MRIDTRYDKGDSVWYVERSMVEYQPCPLCQGKRVDWGPWVAKQSAIRSFIYRLPYLGNFGGVEYTLEDGTTHHEDCCRSTEAEAYELAQLMGELPVAGHAAEMAAWSGELPVAKE